MAIQHPAIVIDNGSGLTKMGYADNVDPQFVIPTAISYASSSLSSNTAGGNLNKTRHLDYTIGFEATRSAKASVLYPIRHGQIDNWDSMEAYWQQCLFKYLRCEPEDHYVLLTEPPLNTPENRECTAEVWFETFGVPGVYIGVQAVLALAASWSSTAKASDGRNPLTGTVIDSGDGVTHVIPVIDGYAVSSAIKHIPLAGRDISLFIQQMLRDRSESVSPEDSLDVARHIKESLCYTAPDIATEFARYDADASKGGACFKQFEHKGKSVDVGYERFLAPEIFFNPEIAGVDVGAPLPELVDSVIQSCPIDGRRGLYSNIVLSGGSTMFKDFSKRLQRDIKSLVDTRLQYTATLQAVNRSSPIVVNVVSHAAQRYAVWAGGSLFASMFPSYCHTKAQYDECGPSVCRQSRVFGNLLV